MRRAILCSLFVLSLPTIARAQYDSQWAPSVGVMLGKLDSNELSALDELVEEATGYATQLKGRSWDICAARGRSGASMTRICYTQLRIDDGGGFQDDVFFDAFTSDVVVNGFKVERQWRLGPGAWPVAPLVTLHGGLGKISGTAVATEYSVTFDPATFTPIRGGVSSVEQEPITEYWPTFGNDWTFLGGASLGLTADLGPHLTMNLGVYGMEFPGVYKGLLQFTYWPR